MEIKGKILCGIAGIFLFDRLGIPFGGLIGFFVGSWLGHYFFDQPREKDQSDNEFKAYQRRQGEFVFHVFRLCAKIAKADGPINEREVGHMESLMRHQFRMNERGRAQAIKIWKNAKESNDTFDQYARAFFEGFGRDRHHVLNMLDLLFATAAADGGLHPREEELLLRAAGVFQVGRLQYERVKARHYHGRMGGGGPQYAAPRWNPLDPHYAILGAEPSDSLDIIKKKYRALAKQWHPDTMAAKGISAEAMRHAKEKFQQINEAYEKITDARK
ncbi:MAG: TerB family tellurite resistance protein [Saprospiraceae bacterium]|nr:TerB family tellurite resistance protein [Saprospiraceae bacterium]